MYLEEGELDQNFSWLSSSGGTKKMHIYFYEIVSAAGAARGGHRPPFLKTFLCSPTNTFPSIEIDLSEAATAAETQTITATGEPVEAGDINEKILNRCLEKLSTEIIQSPEYLAQSRTYYKGFVKKAEEVVLVFEIPAVVGGDGGTGTDSVGMAAASKNGFFMEKCGIIPAILDEIVNRKKIYDVAVDPLVVEFFFEKPRLLYLTTSTFENYEIPQIMYGDTVAPGTTATRTEGEFGYFFYFRAAAAELQAHTKRFAVFTEKNVYYQATADPATASEKNINLEFQAAVIAYEKTQKWVVKCPMFFVEL